ncbi:unnamed protein product [Amoebophrya sp. A25]|nr:unnamed protein product [Amoebophrya sp. A25]|eukprot:GSA25T00024674001.1
MASSCSSAPAGAEKLRVLCLHGFRTNADILETQLEFSVLGSPQVKEFVDFHCLNAPHRCENILKVPAAVRAAFGSQKNVGYREWWNRDGETGTLRGKEATFKYLRQHLEAKRREMRRKSASLEDFYDGILGFSQGGAVSALFLQDLWEEGVAESASSSSHGNAKSLQERGQGNYTESSRSSVSVYTDENMPGSFEHESVMTTTPMSTRASTGADSQEKSVDISSGQDEFSSATTSIGSSSAASSASSSSLAADTSEDLATAKKTITNTEEDSRGATSPGPFSPSDRRKDNTSTAKTTDAVAGGSTGIDQKDECKACRQLQEKLPQEQRAKLLEQEVKGWGMAPRANIPKFAVFLSTFAPQGFQKTAPDQASSPEYYYTPGPPSEAESPPREDTSSLNFSNGVMHTSGSARRSVSSSSESSSEREANSNVTTNGTIGKTTNMQEAGPPAVPGSSSVPEHHHQLEVNKHFLTTMPALFMGQGDDNDIPLSWTRLLAHCFQRGTMVSNPQGGHKIAAKHQMPQENVDAVVDFFRKRWHEKFDKGMNKTGAKTSDAPNKL